MSRRHRERKAARQAAHAKKANAVRRNRASDAAAARYWLTIVGRDCRCSGCGDWLRKGGQLVFRKVGPVTLCVACADADPLVEYRPSLRWERWRAGR